MFTEPRVNRPLVHTHTHTRCFTPFILLTGAHNGNHNEMSFTDFNINKKRHFRCHNSFAVHFHVSIIYALLCWIKYQIILNSFLYHKSVLGFEYIDVNFCHSLQWKTDNLVRNIPGVSYFVSFHFIFVLNITFHPVSLLYKCFTFLIYNLNTKICIQTYTTNVDKRSKMAITNKSQFFNDIILHIMLEGNQHDRHKQMNSVMLGLCHCHCINKLDTFIEILQWKSVSSHSCPGSALVLKHKVTIILPLNAAMARFTLPFVHVSTAACNKTAQLYHRLHLTRLSSDNSTYCLWLTAAWHMWRLYITILQGLKYSSHNVFASHCGIFVRL